MVPSATPEHVIFAGTTPDFTMAAYPTSLSIDAGSSAISYVVLTSLNGFSGTVSLSQSSPSGLVASLSSSIVTLSSGGNASSVLTVSAASSTAPGIYSIIITGTGGGLSHSATVTVSVNQTSPDFSISASPMFLNIQPGTSGSSTIIITALNGFSGTVSLGIAPSQGLAVSLMPASVVGSGTATLTVTAPSNGKYSATVTGISGSLSHAVTVYVTVGTSAAPDFAISASPANLAITAGSSASSTVTLTSLNGFNGTVYLTSQVSPGGLAATLSGVSVSLYPGGSGSSVLTVSASTSTPPGSYTVTVTGSSQAVSHSTAVSVTVGSSNQPDFTISAIPTSQKVMAGSSATSTISLTSVNGFNGTVTLSTSAPPLCVSCPGWGVSPSSVMLPPGGTASSTLTFSTTSGSPLSSWVVGVTGTSDGLSHVVDVTFTIVSSSSTPDFTLMANPSSFSVPVGSSATSTVSLASLNNFSGTVFLFASVSPSGLAATVNPTSVTLSSGGSASSTLTVSSSIVGSYSVTVSGTSDSLSHKVSVTVTVTSSSPTPDFSMTANPASLVIPAGSSATSTIILSSINGFNGTVSLDAPSPLCPSPTCSTWYISPTSVSLAPDGMAKATLTISGGAAGGSGNVTVFGTSGSLSHSANVAFQVVQSVSPDFTLSANPTQISVPPNTSGTSSISVTALNGFSGTVFLTTSSSPGLAANISPHNVTGSGTATLTVNAANAGNYAVTVTGTSGSLFHSVTVSVTVSVPPPPADFTITLTPTSQSVTRGSSTSFTIIVKGSNSFNGTVSLTATVSPLVHRGPTASLPSTVGPYSTSTLTVSTFRSTPTGTYTITITAASGSLTHTSTATVTVTH